MVRCVEIGGAVGLVARHAGLISNPLRLGGTVWLQLLLRLRCGGQLLARRAYGKAYDTAQGAGPGAGPGTGPNQVDYSGHAALPPARKDCPLSRRLPKDTGCERSCPNP